MNDDTDEKGQNLLNRAHVLVVDDEDGVRESIQEAIRDAGFACWGAATGHQALRFLEEKHVDLVISDIRMPGPTGFELTEIVKTKYDTDVIIITGYGRDFQYEQAIEKGASDFILKPIRLQELLVRLRRVMRERALIAQRRQMEERLRELTITDDLTKLFNMRHFYFQVQLEVDRSVRYGHALSLLFLDVDRFKVHNDSYGHLAGDRVLIELGEVIRDCLRKSDTAYRYGGDEFMVLLPETKASEALKVAERIRVRFVSANSYLLHDGSTHATVSVGVAESRQGEKLSEFIRRADQTMYVAKGRGGNQSLLAPE